MGSMSKKFYKDEPTIGKDKETGKAAVTKREKMTDKEKESSKVNAGMDGVKVNEEDVHARHSMDRHMIQAKHEHEHLMHKGGDKHEMHTRHQEELKSTHKRHEKELEGEDSGKGEKEITKIKGE